MTALIATPERRISGSPNQAGAVMRRWHIALVLIVLLICLLVVGTIDYNALGLP